MEEKAGGPRYTTTISSITNSLIPIFPPFLLFFTIFLPSYLLSQCTLTPYITIIYQSLSLFPFLPINKTQHTSSILSTKSKIAWRIFISFFHFSTQFPIPFSLQNCATSTTPPYPQPLNTLYPHLRAFLHENFIASVFK